MIVLANISDSNCTFTVDCGISFIFNRIQLSKSDGATDRRDFSFILSCRLVMKLVYDGANERRVTIAWCKPMRATIYCKQNIQQYHSWNRYNKYALHLILVVNDMQSESKLLILKSLQKTSKVTSCMIYGFKKKMFSLPPFLIPKIRWKKCWFLSEFLYFGDDKSDESY